MASCDRVSLIMQVRVGLLPQKLAKRLPTETAYTSPVAQVLAGSYRKGTLAHAPSSDSIASTITAAVNARSVYRTWQHAVCSSLTVQSLLDLAAFLQSYRAYFHAAYQTPGQNPQTFLFSLVIHGSYMPHHVCLAVEKASL